MPRLHNVSVEETEGETRTFLEEARKKRGTVANIFRGLANSPAALKVYTSLAGAMKQASLTVKEREMIALLTGEINGCDYCVAAHGAAAKMMGFTPEQTLDLRRGEPADETMRALAHFTRAVVEKAGRVSDADLGAVRGAGYGDGAIAEVVAAVAQAIFTNYFNHVFEPEIDFPLAPPLEAAAA